MPPPCILLFPVLTLLQRHERGKTELETGGEKVRRAFGGGHSCFGQLQAACPPRRCLCSLFAFHTAAERAWCCESREKNRREDGGLRAGNQEHESSWETP